MNGGEQALHGLAPKLNALAPKRANSASVRRRKTNNPSLESLSSCRHEELAIDGVTAPRATQAVLVPGAIIHTLTVPTAGPVQFNASVGSGGRSRPSVSKVISQPRSLGGRRPVDRATGAAMSLIDLTHVCVYSGASRKDSFLRSNCQMKTGGRSLSLFLDHFDCQKLFSNRKKNHASTLPDSLAGYSCLSSSKVKNKDRWTIRAINRTVSIQRTESTSSASRKA